MKPNFKSTLLGALATLVIILSYKGYSGHNETKTKSNESRYELKADDGGFLKVWDTQTGTRTVTARSRVWSYSEDGDIRTDSVEYTKRSFDIHGNYSDSVWFRVEPYDDRIGL